MAPLTGFDDQLFLALNASANPPAWLVAFATIAAKYLYYLVPLHMALVWLGGTRFMRFVAVTGLLTMAGGLLFSGLVGLLVYTPRPGLVGIGHTLLDHRQSASFPSNHAIVCFTWAATMAIYGRAPLAAAVAALGLLVAWSRIYLGVHFPIDMIGAAIVSTAFAFAAAKLMTRHGAAIVDLGEAAMRALPLGRLGIRPAKPAVQVAGRASAAARMPR